MKLDFNSYPLNVYGLSSSKSLLKTIDSDIPQSRHSRLSVSQAVLSSFISRAAGAGLLSLIDNVSIGLSGQKARRCLSNMIRKQVSHVEDHSYVLLEEAQFNLMATSCITGYLSFLESGSFGNGVKNIGKALIGLLRLQNPLIVLAESVEEITDTYDDICQVYHIAFLLNVYNSCPQTKDTVKRLIIESLCDDNNGETSFSSKKRPVLFSNSQYKTLWDNEKNRINYLSDEAKKHDELYDPFVKWRKES